MKKNLIVLKRKIEMAEAIAEPVIPYLGMKIRFVIAAMLARKA